MRQFLSRSGMLAALMATVIGIPIAALGQSHPADGNSISLVRDFHLPNPLFSSDSPWRQTATAAALKSQNDKYARAVFDLLTNTLDSGGKPQNFISLNIDQYTIPIFAASPGPVSEEPLLIHSYDCDSWEPSTLPSFKQGHRYYVPGVPQPAGIARPSTPVGRDSDGHLVLYDIDRDREYDFFQATTAIEADGSGSQGAGQPGDKIFFAGSVEMFDARGLGAQRLRRTCRPLTSSRASGTPLLAGLLVPEDLQGEQPDIGHAMVFALPGLRHLCPDDVGAEPLPPDFVYPATKTETSAPVVNRYMLAAGERIRLKPVGALRGDDGQPLDENSLAPITRLYLDALRNYGAYLVDFAGSFAFYAEDVHTANLHLAPEQFNALMGSGTGEPLPGDKTQWQTLIERLQADLYSIPFAVETPNGLYANFDIVENLQPPAGYEPPNCAAAQLNGCPP